MTARSPNLPSRGQGFFDDRTPQILNVPDGNGLGAPSFAGDIGFATTGDGTIVQINLESFTAGIVFLSAAGADVNALEAMSADEAIAAFSNGTVADLRADSSGQFGVAAIFAPLTGEMTDPSAVQAFDSSGSLLVFATESGSSSLFVFGLLPSASSSTGVSTEVTAGQGAFRSGFVDAGRHDPFRRGNQRHANRIDRRRRCERKRNDERSQRGSGADRRHAYQRRRRFRGR